MSGRFQEIVHLGRAFFVQTKPSLCLKLCKKEIKFYEIESSKFLTSTFYSLNCSFEDLLLNLKNVIKTQTLQPQEVMLTLEEEWVLIHNLTLYKGLTESEVEELVRLESSTCFSTPPEELFWDYKILEDVSLGEEIQVLLVAVPIVRVLSLLEALNAVGLKVVHLGLSTKPLDFNLLSWRSQNKKKKVLFSRLFLGALCISGLALYGIHSCLSQKMAVQKLSIQHFEEELVSLKQTNMHVKKLEDQKSYLSKQLYFSQRLQHQRFYMIEVCRVLSQMLPPDIYLKKVVVKNKRIQVVGISPHVKLISLFLDTLKHKVFLRDIELGWVKKIKYKDAHEFQLFFAFRTFLKGYE